MKRLLIITIIALVCVGCSSTHNGLENSLEKQNDTNVVNLNQITKFSWDKVFFIGPYVSKEEIEKKIKIHSSKIEDNNVDETQIYALFVKDEEIVYVIKGLSENLGLDFEFEKYESIKEIKVDNCKFKVTSNEGIIEYKYIENK